MTEIQKVALFPSHRLVIVFLAFLGAVFSYATRINLSVAVVCMVRDKCNKGDTIDNLATNYTRTNLHENGTCSESGEFDWDKATIGRLLAMYFYGYLFLQIPGGWLASRYGGARVWGVCQTVCAVCSLLTPVCARTSVKLTYVLRFILGFAGGVTFPCIHALLGNWSPPLERTKMASVTFSGPLIGTIFTFSISGFLCEYGFDNGWGSIFYIAGIGNLLWVVAWFCFVEDCPNQHKHISEPERIYITASIGKANSDEIQSGPTPWLSVLTSGPLWAIIVAQTSTSYLNNTLLTSLPTFMKESLKFDIKENGVLTSLPYICQFCMVVVFGQVADIVRERNIMSTKNVRKLFQCITSIGAGTFLAVAGQMGRDERYVVVAMLCLCGMFLSGKVASHLTNHLDLAPRYAGLLYGITNIAGNVPGVVAPIVASALTPNGTTEEWRTVFYLCTGIALFGLIFYLFMADGELQQWALPPDTNQEHKMRIIDAEEIPESTEKTLDG
ncbi:hypothetical protein RRG08_044879 [Elysia crispata]|uniref:Major facilitator superfamily (MFS) profile domain-containing protein n=1 Tax=Elysia crispata TaxID=231223 RepID=A0AAE1CEX2_9GAST|nr:hypothetical protein RRG08_044879 [Elysia crispata]